MVVEIFVFIFKPKFLFRNNKFSKIFRFQVDFFSYGCFIGLTFLETTNFQISIFKLVSFHLAELMSGSSQKVDVSHIYRPTSIMGT